jgi:hypothetical protein
MLMPGVMLAGMTDGKLETSAPAGSRKAWLVVMARCFCLGFLASPLTGSKPPKDWQVTLEHSKLVSNKQSRGRPAP